MDQNTITKETLKRGRFVVRQRVAELDTDVSEHPTFEEAEIYRQEVGRTGKHVDLFIVDKSMNTVKDAADGAELAELQRKLEAQRLRSELLGLQEENNRRERVLAGELKAPASQNPPAATTPIKTE